MPFVSKAQQRYFEANKGKLEKQGVNVKEWEKATDYSKLPEQSDITKVKRPLKNA
jgi:hypothetical protein